jgi:hypothetical protein
MTKLDHLNACKRWVKKVVNERHRLHITKQEGKPLTPVMRETMLTASYWAQNIDRFDRMMQWLAQEGVRKHLFELIPTNKEKAWQSEYNDLMLEGRFLQGKIAKQRELQF